MENLDLKMMSDKFFTIEYKEQQEELEKWNMSGFSNLKVKKWKENGFDLETAKVWDDVGFTVEGANTFIKEGLTPQESKELIIREIKDRKKVSITLTDGIYTREQIIELIQKEKMKDTSLF